MFPRKFIHDRFNFESKVEEIDMKLRQREEQVLRLEMELDKQRELREAQVKRELCVNLQSGKIFRWNGAKRRGRSS